MAMVNSGLKGLKKDKPMCPSTWSVSFNGSEITVWQPLCRSPICIWDNFISNNKQKQYISSINYDKKSMIRHKKKFRKLRYINSVCL